MSDLPSAFVEDEEPLVNYILTKNHLARPNSPDRCLKAVAFYPRHESLSVYRTAGWSGAQINEQGQRTADEREYNYKKKLSERGDITPADKRTFSFLGKAELICRQVRDAGLDVTPHEPPPRHANIIGWPQLIADDESARMAKAQALASVAILKMV